MPRITLLNGDVHDLESCETVNELKVRASKLFRDALPSEISILVDGVNLKTDAAVPPQATAIYSSRDRSDCAPWREALLAYAGCGDESVAFCIRELACRDEREVPTILLDALEEPDVRLVRALCLGKADVNAVVMDCDGGGNTPLTLSVLREYVEIIPMLLQAGADVQQPDCLGVTPLCWSARAGIEHCEEFCRAFLSARADVHQSSEGLTPLAFCVSEGNAKVFTILCDAGADINAVSENGITTLAVAAKMGDMEMVNTCLRAGATLDSVDDDGDTVVAACAACEKTNEEIIKYLLSLGAPVGKTALVRAVQQRAVNLIKLLISHDASLVNERVEEKTALEWAENLRAVPYYMKGEEANAYARKANEIFEEIIAAMREVGNKRQKCEA